MPISASLLESSIYPCHKVPILSLNIDLLGNLENRLNTGETNLGKQRVHGQHLRRPFDPSKPRRAT